MPPSPIVCANRPAVTAESARAAENALAEHPDIADNEASTTFVLAEIGQSHSSCNANIDVTAHALCASLHDQGFEAAHGCEIAAFGVSMMAQDKAAVDMEVA